jgi:hypothetical protein
MKVSCPYCGNDDYFYEVAEDVTITTSYVQNDDGSFSTVSDDSKIQGEVRFFCGECHKELKEYHEHFLDMLF